MTNKTKGAPLPSGDIVPLVPMRKLVLFPHALALIAVGRWASVAALQQAIASGGLPGMVLRRDAHDDNPGRNGLHDVDPALHVAPASPRSVSTALESARA